MSNSQVLRKILVIWIAVIVVVAGYVGWVFYSRWDDNRRIQAEAAAKKRDEAQRAVDAMGGDRFEILMFYASPGMIHRGESSMLCYGVSNAKTVSIEPKSGAVWPSLSRCLTVSPEKTTTYTLTAQDAAGNLKTQSIQIELEK
jgi:hypothetical protein